MPSIPSMYAMSVDQISSFGAFYTAAAAFIIAILTLMITTVAMYFALRQYSMLKQSEVALKKTENNQKRFENALQLFTIIGTHQGGSFTELAAIETLKEYPEFHEVYKYILRRFRTFPLDQDIAFFIDRLEDLVKKTKRVNGDYDDGAQ